MNPHKYLFVDRICPTSLVKILLCGHTAQTIWYFEPTGRLTRFLVLITTKVGLISAQLRPVSAHVGQVRAPSGISDYTNLLRLIRQTCRRIRKEHFVNHPLIRALSSRWSKDKILLYLEKMVEKNVRQEFLRIYLVEWIVRTHLSRQTDNTILAIPHTHWLSYFKPFAESQGINLLSYRHLEGFQKVSKWRLSLVKFTGYLVSKILKLRERSSNRVPSQPACGPTLAIRYWHRSLSFNPTERSEFFWLEERGIPLSEVLLYGYQSDQPINAETMQQLQDRNIRVLGNAPGIPSWHPTYRVFFIALRETLNLFRKTMSCLRELPSLFFYLLRHLTLLSLEFSYWYDFFSTNRIRINVGTLNTSVAQSLALDALGGISASYQFTASNILSPTTLLSAGENIQFVFSSFFEDLWLKIDAPVDAFVETGFIYDRVFEELRQNERVKKMKQSLIGKGATFVLCFLDENTVNRWDIPGWDIDTIIDYEFLLRWLLEDPALGIIFKPKYATNLFQRLSGIADLIQNAKQTGRCLFLTSDHLYGHIFPAEAALAADVCVGKLLGSTASFESQLAGVPTLMMDSEGYHDHPLRVVLPSGIIYKDWSSLRKAVENYRTEPAKHPTFGRWQSGLTLLDPFRDGQASQRMRLFIYSLYQLLEKGFSKSEALTTVIQEYKARWGQTSVTPGLINA